MYFIHHRNSMLLQKCIVKIVNPGIKSKNVGCRGFCVCEISRFI